MFLINVENYFQIDKLLRTNLFRRNPVSFIYLLLLCFYMENLFVYALLKALSCHLYYLVIFVNAIERQTAQNIDIQFNVKLSS